MISEKKDLVEGSSGSSKSGQRNEEQKSENDDNDDFWACTVLQQLHVFTQCLWGGWGGGHGSACWINMSYDSY